MCGRFILIISFIVLLCGNVYSLSDRQSLAMSMAQGIVDNSGKDSSGEHNSKETGSYSSESTNSAAKVQYMITNSMRSILEDDLHYTVLEVDEMDPQIAARVIERMLPRPTNGLPLEWRRAPVADTASNRIATILRKSNRELIKYVNFLKRHIATAVVFIRPALPAIAAIAILLINREAITEAVWSTAKEVEKIPPIVSEVISEKSYRWHQWWLIWRNRRSSAKKSSRSKLDINAFLKVQQTSWWDRIVMRMKGIKQLR